MPPVKERILNGKIDPIEDVQKELAEQPKVRLTIPSTERDREDVTVTINGYAYQIKRDVPVEVPQSVLCVLQDAIQVNYKQVKREEGEGMDLIPLPSMRHPFILHQMLA